MPHRPAFRPISLGSIATTLLALALLAACSDKSSGPGDNGEPGEPRAITLELEGGLEEVFVQGGVTTYIPLTLRTPADLKQVVSAELDLVETWKHLTVTPVLSKHNLGALIASIRGIQNTQTWVHVGSDESTVCAEGQVYGPFDFGPTGPPEDTENVELDAPTVQIINNGFAYICLEVVSSFDATVSVSGLEGKVVEEDCDTPADFSGVWSGTYQCGNSCGSSFGGDVEITITQSGTTASYVDGGGDEYFGTVCGNIFKFERIEADEIERGALTLNSFDSATKRSTWRGTNPPHCGGDCLDQLTRISR